MHATATLTKKAYYSANNKHATFTTNIKATIKKTNGKTAAY
ncbi:hypothetical protein [Secundilactobacillus collinoides]|nr:hypothetical protein [Secundilactobacillus collinoides]